MKNPEAIVWRYSVKKVFLETSQKSQESTYARVFFNTVVDLRPVTLVKETPTQVSLC